VSISQGSEDDVGRDQGHDAGSIIVEIRQMNNTLRAIESQAGERKSRGGAGEGGAGRCQNGDCERVPVVEK